MQLVRALAAVIALAALALSGALTSCGGASNGDSPTGPSPPTTQATTTSEPEKKPAGHLKPPPCPADLTDCRRASGTVLYVERVDPDGDGDAHFVLLSRDGITAPGLTIIDVRRDLRPSPLPGPGDRLAAAGPVFPGSRGQLQIEAVAVRTGG